MEQYQGYAVLIVPLMGVLSGALGQFLVELLKRAGLKGRKAIRPIAALVCAVLATALLASGGLLSWASVPIAAVIAWATADANARASAQL